MIRDYWEFLSKEAKARVIFGVALAAVVLLVAIPYFATVLNHHETGVEMAEPVEMSEAKETEETKTETETNEAPSTETAEPENTESVVEEDAHAYTYARSSSQTASQPAAQTTNSAPAETVSRTTVDDRSAGDDGYTSNGIDDQGTDENMETGYGGAGPDTGSSDAETDGGEV